MANPVLVACPAGQWTKVATALQDGKVHITNNDPDKYTYTYRDTGAAAPTLFTEAAPMPAALEFNLTDGIDVYVWPIGAAGQVRADVYPVAPTEIITVL